VDAARRDRWRLVSFFGLAYLLSWAWLIPVAIAGGGVALGRGWPTHFPALAGPAVAALVVTACWDGRAGLADLARRMVRVRVPVRWWLFALSPLLLVPAVLAVNLVLDGDLPEPAEFGVMSGLPAGWGVLVVAAVVLVVNGFGEETGWRGYALPVLQRRHGPLASTLGVVVLWAGWHVPLFFVVDSFRGFDVVTLVGWLIGLCCGGVVLTWLYNRSGGSIALVALWHAGYNLISGTRAAQGTLAAVSTTLVIALAVALVVLEVRAARLGRASVLAAGQR
jgi:membrane protease YdiL (CAAX protease family)